MPATLLRRCAHAAAVVLFATIASFVLLRLAPGDPLLSTVEGRSASAASRAAARVRLGLDEPMPLQVARYVARTLRGDLGYSIAEARPVSSVLADALPATLSLSGTALLLAAIVGIGAGTLQGWRAGDPVARAIGTALTALYALPELVLALALLSLFGLGWGLFPVGGMTDPIIELTGSSGERLLDRARHLALPAVTLALAWGAALARQQRSAMREIVDEHFIRTARAKGVAARDIWRRHAMRPSLPGTVATLGTMLPVLVGGTVIIESLFAWPGMGALMVRAVSVRDYPVVAGAVILVATAVALGSVLTDIVVHAIDPRLRAAADDARRQSEAG